MSRGLDIECVGFGPSAGDIVEELGGVLDVEVAATNIA